jgi:hypothetical protein
MNWLVNIYRLEGNTLFQSVVHSLTPVCIQKCFVYSKEFCRWCITLRITGFLDFVHCPVFLKLENTTFRKQDVFLSSGELLRLAFSKGPNRVGVFPLA